MSPAPEYHDAIGRLAQAGAASGVRLVRLLSVEAGNRYAAEAVEFDDDGATSPAGPSLTVTNLAEPADAAGQVPGGTDAVALDVEGRWVVFVRRTEGSSSFPARVLSWAGGGRYIVREQEATGPGSFADRPGAADVTACNLAELTLGPGAAVEPDTIVLVTSTREADGTVRHVFDHPTYAKYLS